MFLIRWEHAVESTSFRLRDGLDNKPLVVGDEEELARLRIRRHVLVLPTAMPKRIENTTRIKCLVDAVEKLRAEGLKAYLRPATGLRDSKATPRKRELPDVGPKQRPRLFRRRYTHECVEDATPSNVDLRRSVDANANQRLKERLSALRRHPTTNADALTASVRWRPSLAHRQGTSRTQMHGHDVVVVTETPEILLLAGINHSRLASGTRREHI
mmetsp:Transcript_16562/g.45228  ORF Transcript_16562/g.45228 Transcript_16562/m.45228 type:complete len:214 (-) Transcript_16562:1206-1847(-)